MSQLTNSLGFTLQDCNRVMEHTRFLLLTRSTSAEGCCLRIEREARKIAECTSYTPCVLLSAIKRPRRRSAAARQVSNAHERHLVTNQNVYFRPFLGQTYLLESVFFLDPVRELGISASGDWRILCRVWSTKSYMCTCVSGLSLLI